MRGIARGGVVPEPVGRPKPRRGGMGLSGIESQVTVVMHGREAKGLIFTIRSSSNHVEVTAYGDIQRRFMPTYTEQEADLIIASDDFPRLPSFSDEVVVRVGDLECHGLVKSFTCTDWAYGGSTTNIKLALTRVIHTPVVGRIGQALSSAQFRKRAIDLGLLS